MTQPVTPLSLAELSGDVAGVRCGPGALSTARGPLPLKCLEVQARIDGLVARTEVEQTFVNNLGETLEATYIFPLPDRAAVTGFQLLVAGRTIDGLLKERGEARRDYDEALAKGHRAAIAEEERPDVFALRVGNLPANEEIRVKLTLAGPLAVDPGEASYRFPLVVAPRYIPGVPLDGKPVGDGTAADTDAVPDASRIRPPVLLPGYPHPVRLAISVDLNAAAIGARDLCASLPATSEEPEEGLQRIRVVPGRRLDRDFVLRFRIGDEAVTTSLIVERDAGGGGEGSFLLTVVPPAEARDALPPRDIAFVLDRSGSMAGWKIAAARRAMASMVETLRDTDRFCVLAFDDVIESPPDLGDGLVPATSHNRSVAGEFLVGIEARGGTEMAGPLREAVNALAAGDTGRDRAVVLVTDGQVGNEDQILRELSSGLREIRVFTLGIDTAVNAGLLNRLAGAGGGACELVESEARLREVMEKVHRLLATPVLTDLCLDPDGLEVQADSVTPSRLPGLFAAVPVTILGRWSGSSGGSLALKARDREGRAWVERPRAVEGRSGALAALWARGRIRDLEDARACARGNGLAALEKEIVATSLRFSVLSRFTAYVAVDRAAVVEERGDLHRIVQPVEMPAGWEMHAFHACSFMAFRDSMSGTARYSLLDSDPEDSAQAIVELVEEALMRLAAIHPSASARRSFLNRIPEMLTAIIAASARIANMPREPIERIEKLRDETERSIKKERLDPAEVGRLLAAFEMALTELLVSLGKAFTPSSAPPPASSRSGAAGASSAPPPPSLPLA
jgi:Ca-activated chloride channel family protein